MTNRVISIAGNRIFSDAQSFEDLAQMLDDWVSENFNQNIRINEVPVMTAYMSTVLRVGTLVHPSAGWTIKAATITSSLPARGIITRIRGERQAEWAPLAVMDLYLRGSATVGYRPLWLSTFGHATLTEPTAGFRQQVGFVLNYDGAKSTHTCFINPSGGQGETASGSEVQYVTVADITNPTELSSYGDGMVIARQGDKVTLYGWATSSTAKNPYVVAGTGGYWVAMAGQYVNS